MSTLIRLNPFVQLRAFPGRAPSARTSSGAARTPSADWVPAADIIEHTNEYVVRVDLPGVPREAVQVTVDDGRLTIEGERPAAPAEESNKLLHTERATGKFRRSFTLPEDSEPESVSAEFKDGVLSVRLPKSAAKQPRRIEVAVN